MQDILKVFGTNLKRYRKIKGFSQEKFAEKVGFTSTYISLIENGKGNINLCVIELFANILEINYVQFFEKSTK